MQDTVPKFLSTSSPALDEILEKRREHMVDTVTAGSRCTISEGLLIKKARFFDS